MLSKFDIRKNRLDLLYQKQLQKYNALLIFISSGLLGFIGSTISNQGILSIITIISLGIVFLGLFYYFKIMKPEMQSILNQLTQIEFQLKN
ncbi:MAG: hypothetical protein Q7S21_00475 [archaeon]|nr:hypothetical protein [archaeon]